MKPIIAIIGRPNVGKSTLFNRLIGIRYSITSNVAGTTRDRVYHDAVIGDFSAILVDTGGMEFEKKKSIEADVQLQARIALEEADLIFFVLDPTEPLTVSDRDCARLLRKSKKPILLIANKIDTKKSEEGLREILELGLGEAVGISSIHNLGLEDLEEATKKIFKKMKWKKETSKKSHQTRIAIVGKPNVGKSSLVNALVGEERLIVSDIPGTTIDATDTLLRLHGEEFVLIDTAGLRRRGKVRKGLERLGTFRALQAISRCDTACLVLDYADGIANQDLHVSEYILEAGKGLIIVVNKSDLMEDAQEDRKKFIAKLSYRMAFIPWSPVIFTSTISRKNIFQILENAKQIGLERKKKITDAIFQMFTKITVLSHVPARSGHRIIISDGKQTGTHPPTFTFQTNAPDLIHFSYRRFLENEIRRKFGFEGTAIRLEFKKRRE